MKTKKNPLFPVESAFATSGVQMQAGEMLFTRTFPSSMSRAITFVSILMAPLDVL